MSDRYRQSPTPGRRGAPDDRPRPRFALASDRARSFVRRGAYGGAIALLVATAVVLAWLAAVATIPSAAPRGYPAARPAAADPVAAADGYATVAAQLDALLATATPTIAPTLTPSPVPAATSTPKPACGDAGRCWWVPPTATPAPPSVKATATPLAGCPPLDAYGNLRAGWCDPALPPPTPGPTPTAAPVSPFTGEF